MVKAKKPTHQPGLPFPPAASALHQEGTCGRKRVISEGFLSLEIPVPSLDEQDKLIAGFARADEMEREAVRLRQSAWAAFESALFTAPEGIPL